MLIEIIQSTFLLSDYVIHLIKEGILLTLKISWLNFAYVKKTAE